MPINWDLAMQGRRDPMQMLGNALALKSAQKQIDEAERQEQLRDAVAQTLRSGNADWNKASDVALQGGDIELALKLRNMPRQDALDALSHVKNTFDAAKTYWSAVRENPQAYPQFFNWADANAKQLGVPNTLPQQYNREAVDKIFADAQAETARIMSVAEVAGLGLPAGSVVEEKRRGNAIIGHNVLAKPEKPEKPEKPTGLDADYATLSRLYGSDEASRMIKEGYRASRTPKPEDTEDQFISRVLTEQAKNGLLSSDMIEEEEKNARALYRAIHPDAPKVGGNSAVLQYVPGRGFIKPEQPSTSAPDNAAATSRPGPAKPIPENVLAKPKSDTANKPDNSASPAPIQENDLAKQKLLEYLYKYGNLPFSQKDIDRLEKKAKEKEETKKEIAQRDADIKKKNLKDNADLKRIREGQRASSEALIEKYLSAKNNAAR